MKVYVQPKIDVNETENNPLIIECKEERTEYVEKKQDKGILKTILNIYENFGFLGILKYLIIYTCINIIVTVVVLSILITNNKQYKKYKEYILNNPKSIVSETYTEFWCNFGKIEIGILIPYLICCVFSVIYYFILILIEKEKIIFEIGVDLRYSFIIIINLFFFAIIVISPLVILFLIISSFFVVHLTPYDFLYNSTNFMKNWQNEKYIFIIHNVILIIIFSISFTLLTFNQSLYHYFLTNYFNNDENKINANQKIKSKKIWINNKYYNFKIKIKNLFLLQKNNKSNFYQLSDLEMPKINKNYIGKCLTFKEILFEEKQKNFMYINLDHISIKDQIPFTINGYSNNNKLFIITLIVLILSIFPFKLHIENENAYKYYLSAEADELGILDQVKNTKFYNIIKIYGNYEKKVSYSRFISYIISTAILFILLIIRSVYGGFRYIISIIMTFVITILICLLNLTYIILSFLIILFSIFFFVSKWDKEFAKNTIINIKLLFQIIVNVFLVGFLIYLFIISFFTILYFWNIIKDRKKICKDINIVKDNLNTELIFDYTDLHFHDKKLYEFKIQNLPKYLFYISYLRQIGHENELNNILDTNNNESRNNDLSQNRAITTEKN